MKSENLLFFFFFEIGTLSPIKELLSSVGWEQLIVESRGSTYSPFWLSVLSPKGSRNRAKEWGRHMAQRLLGTTVSEHGIVRFVYMRKKNITTEM